MAIECEVKPLPCFFDENSRGDQHVFREEFGGTSQYYVLCFECGARGPKRDTPEQAAEDWNAIVRKLDPLPTMTEMREQTFDKLSTGDTIGREGTEYVIQDIGEDSVLHLNTPGGHMFIVRRNHWIEGDWSLIEKAEKKGTPT